ncbi:MAG: cellulase family glycosylhydrolase [Treponema sp.]|nr:cellulase family glycosylhydrolase [Treponema sp.]
MKKTRLFGVAALAALAVFALAACGGIGDSTKAKTPAVTAVTVSPSTADVAKGGFADFTAEVAGTGSPPQTVTWSIVEAAGDAGTAIDENGRLSVAAGESLASLTVKAVSTADPGKSGTAAVTISGGDIGAAALVRNIKLGWNLGNTLDTVNLFWLDEDAPVSQLETAWGNPVATKANIDAVKNAGFNAIRIPVSWSKCADSDFNIRADWMERVTEVVNYAVSNDMYILLNTHHDEDIFKFTNANAAESKKAFQKIWEQIAVNFRDFDEKLIFEALNEPRTIGSAAEWTGGTSEEHGVLNDHYQLFVDTVRATGGNNGRRILMVNTYAASAEAAAVNGLAVPSDTVPDKIIVSIHAYTPWSFADNSGANASKTTWSKTNSSDTGPIDTVFNRAYTRFVSQGIPVIMGEFGAVDKGNTGARAAWAEYYVSCAADKGIPCFYWDDGGNFKLLDRGSNVFVFPEITAAMILGTGGTAP